MISLLLAGGWGNPPSGFFKTHLMPYTDHTQPNTTEEFNQVAPQYDGHFDNRFDRAEENVLFRRFAHLLQLSDVLDIGCGTGLVKRLSDRLLFRPRSYTGIDASDEMISQAVKPQTPEDALRTKFFVDDIGDMLLGVCNIILGCLIRRMISQY